MKLQTVLTLSTFALATLSITTAHAGTVPDDGDSWSEYANWVEAYNDGWNPECGLTLQIITPNTAGDWVVGAGSVGFELQTGVWNKKFTYENPEWSSVRLPMDGLTALHFWYRTTWEIATPLYGVRVYVEPTEAEEFVGVTAKRLSWQIPTSLTWTEFQGSFEDAVWECYSGALWSPCADTATSTRVLKLEWDYFEIFGPGAGHRTLIDGLHFVTEASSPVSEPNVGLAVLLCNHPNPFNPQTIISFVLPSEMAVSLYVYDVSGRLVHVLVEDAMAPRGRNEVIWKGRDQSGRQLPSGTYFYRLETEGFVETKRMTLLK